MPKKTYFSPTIVTMYYLDLYIFIQLIIYTIRSKLKFTFKLNCINFKNCIADGFIIWEKYFPLCSVRFKPFYTLKCDECCLCHQFLCLYPAGPCPTGPSLFSNLSLKRMVLIY